jgi:hypothetical protein
MNQTIQYFVWAFKALSAGTPQNLKTHAFTEGTRRAHGFGYLEQCMRAHAPG